MTKIEEILESAKYLDGVGMPQTATWLREYAAALAEHPAQAAAEVTDAAARGVHVPVGYVDAGLLRSLIDGRSDYINIWATADGLDDQVPLYALAAALKGANR